MMEFFFDRKSCPSIKRHLDGHRNERPPDRKPKLPFSECHVNKIFIFCVNKWSYKDVMGSAALLIGCTLSVRHREIVFAPGSLETIH